MALQEPPGLLGIHTNMAATVPANISKALAFHEAPPADLTAEERNAWDQLDFFYKKGLGYALEMANRPQTLYALVDSPIGLAAWMIDHDARSQEMIAPRLRRKDGRADAGRRPRQYHALLADEHRDLLGASLLGHRDESRRGASSTSEGRQDPGRRECLSRRDLRGPTELGGEGVSQADPLQQARQRHTLRGLGAAGAFRCGASNRVQAAAQVHLNPSARPHLGRLSFVRSTRRFTMGEIRTSGDIDEHRRRFFGTAAGTIAAVQLGVAPAHAQPARRDSCRRSSRGRTRRSAR